jgi:phosphoribosylglycinamide formyltransferase-1
MNVCVMVSGGGTNLQSLMDHYPDDRNTEKPARVSLVVSDNPEAFGLERARRAGVKTCVISPNDFGTHEEFGMAHIRLFTREDIALVVLAGYLKLVPGNVISEFRNKMINIHPALLPSFGGKGMYGKRVHQAVIESGVKLSGLTIHFVDERFDHGPILLQYPVPVYFSDTPEALAKRILEREHRMLPFAVGLIAAGRVEVRGQRVYIEGEENMDWSRALQGEIS